MTISLIVIITILGVSVCGVSVCLYRENKSIKKRENSPSYYGSTDGPSIHSSDL